MLSALAPGAAQLAVGRRRIGLIALRVWGVLLGLVLLLGLVGWISWSALLTVVANPLVLALLVVAMVVGALVWIALFIDAWRLSYPPAMDLGHRRAFAGVTLALVVLVGSTYGLGARAALSSTQTLGTVFTGGGTVRAADGRVNVLLLGADAGQSREGLRPDSLTLASIDVRTGRTVLFSLPRNLEDVPFPEDSPMHRLFPDGYSCPDHSCMLNAVYTEATEAARQDPKLYPGVGDPGAQATKEAVKAATGLEINYYAMVDMAGFSGLVDALGGITLDIARDVPIGGGSSPILGWIPAGRGVHLDGNQALWFARSREGSNDFERMQRQKCVMTAVLHQTDPVTVVAKFDELARAGGRIVVTDVPRSDIGRLSDLALKARELPITNVSFVPPLIYPGNPKYEVLHETVAGHIEEAEQLDRQARGEQQAEQTDTHSDAQVEQADAQSGQGSAGSVARTQRTPVAAQPAAVVSQAPSPAAAEPAAAGAGRTAAAAPSTAPEIDDLDAICRVASAG